jgi:hypothetical protein
MKTEQFEYAGFQFVATLGDDDKLIGVIAKPGQHAAAYKERHRMAAREQWFEDHPKR